MSKINANVRWLTTLLLAASLVACGTVQGATPGRAGVQLNGGPSDVHLLEYDVNDTQPAPLQDGGDAAGETGSGPALVP